MNTMTIKRVSIPLSEQEYVRLANAAQRGYRRIQDYARMIVLESLHSDGQQPAATNNKPAPVYQDTSGFVGQH